VKGEVEALIHQEIDSLRSRLEGLTSADIASIKGLRESMQGLQLKMDAMWVRMHKMMVDGNDSSSSTGSPSGPSTVIFPSFGVDTQLKVQLNAAEAQIKELVDKTDAHDKLLKKLKQPPATEKDGDSPSLIEELQRIQQLVASHTPAAAAGSKSRVQHGELKANLDSLITELNPKLASRSIDDVAPTLQQVVNVLSQDEHRHSFPPTRGAVQVHQPPDSNKVPLTLYYPVEHCSEFARGTPPSPSVSRRDSPITPAFVQRNKHSPPTLGFEAGLSTPPTPSAPSVFLEVQQRLSLKPMHVVQKVEGVRCQVVPPPSVAQDLASRRLTPCSPRSTVNTGVVSPPQRSSSPGVKTTQAPVAHLVQNATWSSRGHPSGASTPISSAMGGVVPAWAVVPPTS
jgi:hypothetical protein